MRNIISGLSYTVIGGLLAALMAGPHIASVKNKMWQEGFDAGRRTCAEEGV